MTATISFGVANSVTRDFPSGTTVGALRRDNNLRAILGFPENVDFTINGATLGDNTPVGEGDNIVVVTRAASKA